MYIYTCICQQRLSIQHADEMYVINCDEAEVVKSHVQLLYHVPLATMPS